MVSPDEDTESSRRVTLYVPYGMVRYALPILNVSGAVLRGFYALCSKTRALNLEWLVHADDSTNASKQHELSISEVLPKFSRSFVWEAIF